MTEECIKCKRRYKLLSDNKKCFHYDTESWIKKYKSDNKKK